MGSKFYIMLSIFTLFVILFNDVEATTRNSRPLKKNPIKKHPIQKNPIHGLKNWTDTMITRKFNRHSLENFLAKKPNLWKSKFVSAAQRKFYKSSLGGSRPTKHDMEEASRTRIKGAQLHLSVNKKYEELPTEFDSREKWPACPSIGKIQNQAKCGSCWAVASASVMSDRLCISSNGERKVQLSSLDLMSCCLECQATEGDGCQGGYASRAFKYFQNRGLVTDSCKPYPFSSESAPMVEGENKSPSCTTKCEDGQDYYSDKHYGGDLVYPDTMESIQQELFENGPITTFISVHQDLMGYDGGVYYNKFGDEIGGHSVRIIGWGEEDGLPYWLMANSWGDNWGLDGLFKIVRGTNHLNIESLAVASSYDYNRSTS